MGDRRADNDIYRMYIYSRFILLVVIMLLTIATGMSVRAEGLDAGRVYGVSTSGVHSLMQEGPEGSGSEFNSEEGAGLYIREQMKQRKEKVEFEYYISNPEDILFSYNEEIDSKAKAYSNAIWSDIFRVALEHTGDPAEGDYLMSSLESTQMTASIPLTWGTVDNSIRISKITFIVSFSYYTTADQEKEFEQKAASVINGLNLSGDTEYEKVVKIYDYITNHVTYDYANLNNANYLLKQSAYAALINGTSVCQGYATLFNYMAKSSGLESRIIMGKSYDDNGQDGELHAWNAVKIGNSYYYVDATWDSVRSEDIYFLKGTTDFTNHKDIYIDTPDGEVEPGKIISLGADSYYNSVTKTVLTESNASVTVGDVTLVEDVPSVKVEVSYGGKALIAGIDYKVDYGIYYTNIGKGTVDISGIGLYQGTVTVEYEVPGVSAKDTKNAKSTDDSKNISQSSKSIKVGTQFKVGSLTYKVTKAGGIKTVTLVAAGKNLSKVNIPATVRKGGDIFLVKAIGNGVFKNNSKLTSVVIGKNVESIGANCFSGCKKLKKVTFRGSSLKKVGSGALKKTYASIVVTIPKSVKAGYVKLLKRGGISKKARYK